MILFQALFKLVVNCGQKTVIDFMRMEFMKALCPSILFCRHLTHPFSLSVADSNKTASDRCNQCTIDTSRTNPLHLAQSQFYMFLNIHLFADHPAQFVSSWFQPVSSESKS